MIKKASELQPGDTIYWNSGAKSIVKSVTPNPYFYDIQGTICIILSGGREDNWDYIAYFGMEETVRTSKTSIHTVIWFYLRWWPTLFWLWLRYRTKKLLVDIET